MGFHAALLVTDIYFDFEDFSGRGADFSAPSTPKTKAAISKSSIVYT